ncbi:MAG: hypothetical protein M5U34_39190 [Chloroflexi bacterium]|nr:hypothetical protein [Chloroflexota bacterium]
MDVKQALLGALLATLLHWLSEFWHHFGHAQAAKRTGYPMSGVCAVGPLATLSIHPTNRPCPAVSTSNAL